MQVAPLALEQRLDAPTLQGILDEFAGEDDAVSKMQLLIKYARMLPAMPDLEKTAVNRVMGCTTQVLVWPLPPYHSLNCHWLRRYSAAAG